MINYLEGEGGLRRAGFGVFFFNGLGNRDGHHQKTDSLRLVCFGLIWLELIWPGGKQVQIGNSSFFLLAIIHLRLLCSTRASASASASAKCKCKCKCMYSLSLRCNNTSERREREVSGLKEGRGGGKEGKKVLYE